MMIRKYILFSSYLFWIEIQYRNTKKYGFRGSNVPSFLEQEPFENANFGV
jgi:hypothetical protein